jgi:putative two-component system response regulator
MRVLIVDDDPIAVEMLRDTLADAGHEVATASDGRAALASLDAEPCQVVITDWEMPGMNGIALCREVRRRTSMGYVYVVLLTGHGTTAERIEGLSAGADDFITKPFEPGELTARLQSAERILSLETRDVAIFAMAKLAESRDTDTGSHLERVQNYSRILAQQLLAMNKHTDAIDAEFVRLVYSTSPLHDIGKVGIPDSVLLKPGRLSDREFQIMKTHTTIGAQTLDAAMAKFPKTPFLRMARDIAAAHHERWDGGGYPAGAAGAEIPLSARIVAVADVYDALTSRRVYKDAFTHDIARAIILNDSGTHFDPDIVEAFVAAEQAFVAVRERYRGDSPVAQAA